MVVTLTGENSFGLGSELNKLMSDFVAEHGDLAVERLDGTDVDFAQIEQGLTSIPFFSSKKLVVLHQGGANKEFVERAEELIKNITETTDLIIVEPKLDKRQSYYKTLKSKTDLREFLPPDEAGLTNWLVNQAKEEDATLSLADARYLIERAGTNQLLLLNELNKLVLYDPKITRGTIDLLIEPNPQSKIFDLLEAAFNGRSRKAMDLYEEQRAQKIEPPVIIAMISWQLHALALVMTAGNLSPNDIASQAGMNPYVIRKTQTIARELSLEKLKQLIDELLYIDTRVKTTKVDTDEALKNYLLKLSLVKM